MVIMCSDNLFGQQNILNKYIKHNIQICRIQEVDILVGKDDVVKWRVALMA